MLLPVAILIAIAEPGLEHLLIFLSRFCEVFELSFVSVSDIVARTEENVGYFLSGETV